MADVNKHIMDRTILDKNGRRAGKVDDLVLEVPTDNAERLRGEPEIVALVSGPLSLMGHWPVASGLARLGYWLLGVRDPRPAEVAWSHVTQIDVVVHLDLDREQAHLDEPSRSAARRFIERIPGA